MTMPPKDARAGTSKIEEIAIWVASEAHQGQVDKCGAPYILHPLRVMSHFVGDQFIYHRCVAVLHDVVEDTPVDLQELAQIFPEEVCVAIDAITERDGESYSEYIKRLALNRIARSVKLRDLKDNQHPVRQAGLTVTQAQKYASKYAWALHYLMNYNMMWGEDHHAEPECDSDEESLDPGRSNDFSDGNDPALDQHSTATTP